jgi:hypothetical protein
MMEESHLAVFDALTSTCRVFFRLSGESLSGACPPESNQDEDTQPSRPKGSLALLCEGLSSVPDFTWASIETRPSGLHTPQATAELEQPMADYPHFVSATQRGGMGFISPNNH